MDIKNFIIALILTLVLICIAAIHATIDCYEPSRKEVEETTAPTLTCVEATENQEMSPLQSFKVKIIEPAQEPEPYLSLTDEEKRLFATLLYHEARGESYECQMAVGSTVLNRMEVLDMSLREVIYQKYNGHYQFSPAPLLERKDENGNYVWEPYEEQWQVVEELCKNGPTLPYYVLFFRADYHHSWAEPFCVIDETYFSYMKMHM